VVATYGFGAEKRNPTPLSKCKITNKYPKKKMLFGLFSFFATICSCHVK
jgi:hypothetical protein